MVNQSQGNGDGMDLTTYDIILVNTSGGKDSQSMLDFVHGLAAEQGVADRLVAVHANLGRMEWQGSGLASVDPGADGIPRTGSHR